MAIVLADAALTSASTLTASATDMVPALSALTAASTLTASVIDTVPALSALTSDSTLTASATDITSAIVSLVAMSSLTPVALAGAPLGVITMAVGPVVAAVPSPQPGTLANPYMASSSDTRSTSFASALFVATEPVAITGPAAAPSIWYEFTEAQVANLTASTSGFANGAVIELYSGPPGAGPGDLTFIATDGSSPITLGAVTLSALVTTVATSLRVGVVDLGAVAVAVAPAVAAVLT